MYHETVEELLEAWDKGDIIWSIEMGGLGPGYEQAIQVCAVEFARAGKGMVRSEDDEKDVKLFDAICTEALKKFNDGIGGITGAQYGAAKWLAWQWCFNGGPKELIERCKERGENDRTIQVDNRWVGIKESEETVLRGRGGQAIT